jgi:TRAP-type mannitol/chloroaromatic compound transport system permease large subunit
MLFWRRMRPVAAAALPTSITTTLDHSRSRRKYCLLPELLPLLLLLVLVLEAASFSTAVMAWARWARECTVCPLILST